MYVTSMFFLHISFPNAVFDRVWPLYFHILQSYIHFGVGNTLANVLVNAGLTSFEKIVDKNPRDLELVSHVVLVQQVDLQVRRLCSRLMTVRVIVGMDVFNLVSVYAP